MSSFNGLPLEMQIMILKYFPQPKPKRFIIIHLENKAEYVMRRYEIRLKIKVTVDLGDDTFSKDISSFCKYYQTVYISTGRMFENIIDELPLLLSECNTIYRDKVMELTEDLIPNMFFELMENNGTGSITRTIKI